MTLDDEQLVGTFGEEIPCTVQVGAIDVPVFGNFSVTRTVQQKWWGGGG